jgi:hypothetical protein
LDLLEFSHDGQTVGSEQREIGSPIHGDAIDEPRAALYPRVAASHHPVEARLVEEHQLLDGNAQDPEPEGSPLRYDVGVVPLTLQRPVSLFLITYPNRWSARFVLGT